MLNDTNVKEIFFAQFAENMSSIFQSFIDVLTSPQALTLTHTHARIHTHKYSLTHTLSLRMSFTC